MSSELTPDQLEQVQRELDRGLIYAVKMYKDATGCSLLEAKQACERIRDGRDPGERISDDQWMDGVLDALGEGRKLEAIKLYREKSGKSLKESKEFVENLAKELNLDMPSGCAGMILLLITLGGCGGLLLHAIS